MYINIIGDNGSSDYKRLSEVSMSIVDAAKDEFVKKILEIMVTPNVKKIEFSNEDELNYNKFIKDVKAGKKATVVIPLEFTIREELFNLIKEHKLFVSSSVKFKATVTTEQPKNVSNNSKLEFYAHYKGNEFHYSFLDNHPGIINIDRLKDIPIDYEGLMAVPLTVLVWNNIQKFNVHRVIYSPRHCGKVIYPRIVISNKVSVSK